MASKVPKKIKIMVSDCHLSAGRFYEGRLNLHEDFYFDDELKDLIEFFSTGIYAPGPSGPEEIELILGGDFLDFLNVFYQGEFEDTVSEALALYKLEAIIRGHPVVMESIRKFASLPGRHVTYLIGNHDADLFFEKVRERITREWDPEGKYPSERVQVIADRDRITYPEGVEIRHGNQFESGNDLNFDQPFVHAPDGRDILNLPWSSIYVLKIVNRLKWDREYIDKVRPVKAYMLFGLLFDTWFTIKYLFLSAIYFAKTRLNYKSRSRWNVKAFLEAVREESVFFQDLERQARKVLDERSDLKTIIMGHTHRPMDKIYPDGKQYINTGTWTKMIDLDWRGLGQQFRRTFALVQIFEDETRCELRQWMGEHSPHKIFQP